MSTTTFRHRALRIAAFLASLGFTQWHEARPLIDQGSMSATCAADRLQIAEAQLIFLIDLLAGGTRSEVMA